MSREAGPGNQGEPRFLQIGEVAELTGLTPRTLRYYEEVGLVVPSGRLDGGFRLYTEDDIQSLVEIRRLKEVLGASLREIKEMLQAEEELKALKADYHQAVDENERHQKLIAVRQLLRRQLVVVDGRSEQLAELRSTLVGRLGRVDELLSSNGTD